METIRQILHLPQTKMNRDAIVKKVRNNPNQMTELMDCFFSDDYRLCQNASWPMTIIGEKKPKLILPYVEEMLGVLRRPVHNSVKRNVIRLLQVIDIPEEYDGIVYELCFNYINDTKEMTAVRTFSITVLCNIVMKYPELKGEVISLIELHRANSSAAFKARVRKELKRLE